MSLGQDGPPTRTRLPEGEGGHGSAARRPQPRRALMTVVGVVVVLIAALAFATRGGGSGSGSGSDDAGGGTAGSAPHSAGSAARATAPSGQAPVTGHVDGIPSGYAHTSQGAQSAAANYAVALGGTDMFNTDARHRIVATLYTPAATARLQSQLDQAYSSSAITALGLNSDGSAPQGQTFVSRTVPVGTKATASTDDTATVEVWCTALSGLAGQDSTKPVTTSWFTITEKLVWTAGGTDGDWRIDSSSQAEGPAPVSGDQQVATADQIAGAVQQYGGFTYAR
ncbi:hypothetical protein [Actinacidiphila yeochonensis]|uniref:hypothetical protein n=1 Tax=Actinacidiphila yeochonensis TaxID=89050 RepID=UPI000559F649|nr:hypothetical protein [Actinacidiphila yeochonensis]